MSRHIAEIRPTSQLEMAQAEEWTHSSYESQLAHTIEQRA